MAHSERPMQELPGRSISSGLGWGKAYVYQDILQRDLENYDIEPEQIEDEYARIQDAVRAVQQDLESAAEAVTGDGDTDLAGIFQAHQMMLADPAIHKDIKKELESELVNAEQIVKHVFRRWQRKLPSSNAETAHRPGDDIADIGRQLLRHLAGLQAHVLEDLPDGSVVVAKRLLPSDTVFLSRQATEAIVLEFAGPLSHAARLTRELGVPAVSGISQVLDKIPTGDTVWVDGEAGRVVGHPAPPLGAMIETPATALCAAEVSRYSDFLSIGTNDLTQYTMVAGRENPTVSEYFMDDHSAIRQRIQLTTQGAPDTPVSICGELASRQPAGGTSHRRRERNTVTTRCSAFDPGSEIQDPGNADMTRLPCPKETGTNQPTSPVRN